MGRDRRAFFIPFPMTMERQGMFLLRAGSALRTSDVSPHDEN
jgi:hypothetical protein